MVSLKPGKAIDLPEIVRFLKEHKMAMQYIPERLEVLETLPCTPSGKIQKHKLRDLLRNMPA
jgi:cyclohexanecarboxylate-CoA ligase